MPNTNTAAKRMRQNAKTKMINRARKTAIKNTSKKVIKAVADGNLATAEEAFRATQKKLDKAVKSNTIHKNKAARRKSRLQKKINALKASS